MGLENYILNEVKKLERIKSESIKLTAVKKWIEDYNDNLKKEGEEEKKHREFYHPFSKTLHLDGFEKRVRLWKEKGLKYMIINEDFDRNVEYDHLNIKSKCLSFTRIKNNHIYDSIYIYNVSLSRSEFEDMRDYFIKIGKKHLKKLDIKRRKRAGITLAGK